MTTADIQIELEIIKDLLARGISGKQSDPSWMRPKSLTAKERADAFQRAYFHVERLLKDLT